MDYDMNSILTSTKKLLGGIPEEDEHFDIDIIMFINSTFAILNQLGVGPEDGFVIEDSTTTWTEYLGDTKRLEFVKTYIQNKVKLAFDPPQNSALLNALKESIAELEFRIIAETDKPDKED